MLLIGWRNFAISKIQNTVQWTYVFSDLNGEEIVGIFHEKELQKTNQEEFRLENAIKNKKEINCMLNGNTTIVLLIVALIKKTYKMS